MEKLSNTSILITGGCGFIGSNIVEHLAERVKFIRILDNLNYWENGKCQFLLDKYDNIELMYGDITRLRKIVEKQLTI